MEGVVFVKRITVYLSLCLSVLVVVGCAGRDSGTRSSTDTSSGSPPANAVAVQRNIPFASQAGVRLEVKKECKLQTKVPRFVEQYASDHGVAVRLVEDLEASDARRKLKIEILALEAPDNWTDEDAWMLVQGDLYEDGEKIATVKSRRETEGGAFAEFKSSCAIIGRCSEAIGDDLAGWLKDPQDGARIGNWPRRGPRAPRGRPGMPNPPGPM